MINRKKTKKGRIILEKINKVVDEIEKDPEKKEKIKKLVRIAGKVLKPILKSIANKTLGYIKDYPKIEFEEIEILSLEEIINWFKQELNKDQTRENYSLLIGDFKKLNENYAEFVKSKYLDKFKYPYLLIQGFYDEKTNKFVHYRLIATQYLEKELEDLLKENGVVFFE